MDFLQANIKGHTTLRSPGCAVTSQKATQISTTQVSSMRCQKCILVYPLGTNPEGCAINGAVITALSKMCRALIAHRESAPISELTTPENTYRNVAVQHTYKHLGS